MMIDLGTGNNNKINWALDDKQEFLDILEVVYKGAKKGITWSKYAVQRDIELV